MILSVVHFKYLTKLFPKELLKNVSLIELLIMITSKQGDRPLHFGMLVLLYMEVFIKMTNAFQNFLEGFDVHAMLSFR